MDLTGIMLYVANLALIAGVYAVITIGLNVHYGHTGLFNVGVAAFFALGAYVAALLAIPPPDENLFHAYKFGGDLARILGVEGIGIDIWFPIVLVAAGVSCAILAYLIGAVTIRLREDYLAIATLGLGEAVRLVFTNEAWLADGTRGLPGIPRVLDNIVDPRYYDLIFLPVVLAVLLAIYLIAQRLAAAPWGRVLLAIRENEDTVEVVGKNVFRFKLQAFAFGAAIMGVGGALYAFARHSITPMTFEPFIATFVVWAMLIIGGSGNHRGAILGAAVLWAVIGSSQFLPGFLSDPNMRLIVVGVMIVGVLMLRPAGILPETRTRT